MSVHGAQQYSRAPCTSIGSIPPPVLAPSTTHACRPGCTSQNSDRKCSVPAHALPVDVVPHCDRPDDYVRLAPLGREVLLIDVVPVVVPAA
eukprot:100147-Rhodomonas_salina.1